MSLAVFNLPDLVYHIAHDYPGWIPALALRMDMSANVLNKKVNPSIDSHVLTQKEFNQIVDFADADKRLIHALCANNGGVFVSTVSLDGISDMALLETYTSLMSKFGEFSKDFNAALIDSRITRAEIKTMRSDYYNFQAAMETLFMRLESLVDD